MAKTRKQLDVLFYPSAEIKGRWVAHCLDYDLVGTGDTLYDAHQELLGVIENQIKFYLDLRRRGKKAVMPGPAPKEYWDALKAAEPLPPPDISQLARHIPVDRIGRRSIPNRCAGAWLKNRPTIAAAV